MRDGERVVVEDRLEVERRERGDTVEGKGRRGRRRGEGVLAERKGGQRDSSKPGNNGCAAYMTQEVTTNAAEAQVLARKPRSSNRDRMSLRTAGTGSTRSFCSTSDLTNLCSETTPTCFSQVHAHSRSHTDAMTWFSCVLCSSCVFVTHAVLVHSCLGCSYTNAHRRGSRVGIGGMHT